MAKNLAVQLERPQQLIAAGLLVNFFYFLLFHRAWSLFRSDSNAREKPSGKPDLGIRDRLNELLGTALGKAYVDEMVKAQTKDVSALQQTSKNAKTPR